MISPIISINPKIMADEIQRLKEGSRQYDALRSLSAKNLNSFPYYRSSGYEASGVTFTYDASGIITANGTATANATFACHSRSVGATNSLILPNGVYKLTGGVNEKCYVFANNTIGGSASSLGTDYGDGVLFHLVGSDSVPEGFSQVATYCVVASGETVTNFTFKPMLELISLDDPEAYQPYTLSNQELTTGLNALKCTETTAGTYKLQATVAADGSVSYEWVEVV